MVYLNCGLAAENDLKREDRMKKLFAFILVVVCLLVLSTPVIACCDDWGWSDVEIGSNIEFSAEDNTLFLEGNAWSDTNYCLSDEFSTSTSFNGNVNYQQDGWNINLSSWGNISIQ